MAAPFKSQSGSQPSEPSNPFARRVILLPSVAYRLSKIDTSHLKIPYYRKGNFLYFVGELTYKGFRNQILDKNPEVPITRAEMDALWVKLLIKYFRVWELTQNEQTRDEKKGGHASWLRIQLSAGLNQRMGRILQTGKVFDDTEAWWAKFAVKYPGLDVKPNPELKDENYKKEDQDEDGEIIGNGGGYEENVEGGCSMEGNGGGEMMEVDTEMGDGEEIEGEVTSALGFGLLAHRPRQQTPQGDMMEE